MGLLDFFKKKKKIEGKRVEKKKIEGEKIEKEKKPLEKKEEKIKPQVIKPRKKVSEISCRVLSSPHVTEKATMLGEKNKYTFKIWSKANKIEVKEAIEGIYGVDVIDVKVINIPRKKRRLGRQIGWRKGYKKAIVRIKEGQKIEILSR